METPAAVFLLILMTAGALLSPRCCMGNLLREICSDLEGQDIAEYAVMVGALLVLIFGLMRAL